MVDQLIWGAGVFGFIFGLCVGVVGTYFVMRFKTGLSSWWKRTEDKIESTLSDKK